MQEPEAMLLLIQEFGLAWKQQTNGCTGKAKKLHIFAKHGLVVWNKCCILCFLTSHLLQMWAHLRLWPWSGWDHSPELKPLWEQLKFCSVSLGNNFWFSKSTSRPLGLGAAGSDWCSCSRLAVGWSTKMPLERVICKWGWSHYWTKV